MGGYEGGAGEVFEEKEGAMIRKYKRTVYMLVCDNCGSPYVQYTRTQFFDKELLLNNAKNTLWFINDPIDGKDFCCTNCLLDYREKKKGGVE